MSARASVWAIAPSKASPLVGDRRPIECADWCAASTAELDAGMPTASDGWRCDGCGGGCADGAANEVAANDW